MKFSCERYILLSSISAASRAVSSKSTIPALEGLLLEAGDGLTVTGYDLKTGIRTAAAADVAEPGAIVLNANLFSGIVKKLSDDTVTIETDGSFVATIRCGMSEFNVIGSDPSEYPELPSVDYLSTLSIPQDKLKRMIAETIFAVSEDENRIALTGSLFEVEKNELTVISVDGFRLAVRKEALPEAGLNDCSFIVPGSALREVERIACEDDQPVRINLGQKHIIFEFEDTLLISRRLEGEFINYRQAVQGGGKYAFKADRRELCDAAERVSFIISERLKSPLRLKFLENKVEMSAATALGKSRDVCKISGDGEGLEVGFNNQFLLDALKTAPADELILKTSSPVSACLILPADGSDSFLYMVLPVRIRAGE